MFAYCLNNSVNLKDNFGNDAIWIQESHSAKGFGHSGLISQDENGDWYYFFWGPADESFSSDLITGRESAPVFEILITDGCDMTTKEGVIAAINQTFEEDDIRNRSDLITSTCYFRGDYTNTTAVAEVIASSAEQYSVLFNNCVQNTLFAFMASDSRFGLATQGTLSDLIPNQVYSKICLIPSNQDDYPWALIFGNAAA